MSLDPFHPAVAGWFDDTFDSPTEAQVRGWPAIRDGSHTLIAAPTGSGKTLAAFLTSIDDLVRQGLEEGLEEGVHVVYVSPLKALSNDVEKNLQAPLEGIRSRLKEMGYDDVPIRTAVRTGDTPQLERRRMVKEPPHILVTTPESLYLLLTSDSGREMLGSTRTLIVDETHAVADNKRGSHLSLTMERLHRLVDGGLIRVGLSATQRPIEEVAQFLVGSPDEECRIVDGGHARELDLGIEVTGSPLTAVMSAEHMEEVYDRLAGLIASHRTTLVFTNTRREAERVTRHLEERLGEGEVTSHHGSLSKERRLAAERDLKQGDLQALVATASMELGIDIGFVDLVCQMGSVRGIGTLLQRVGRSGHSLGETPKGRIFPLTRDELVEATALVDSVRRGELDLLQIPEAPLDILAQQLVAMSSCEEWSADDMYELATRAYPYRDLQRGRFDDVLAMLSDGFSTSRGRRGAYVHWDEINDVVRGRKSARLTALTSGGAIPDRADFRVILDPTDTFIGTLDEDFAIESMPGDIFQLGNASWQIVRVESGGGKVRVVDAKGQPPTLPFWFGEAPSRTVELSEAVSRVREEVAGRVDVAKTDEGTDIDVDDAVEWLEEEVGLSPPAANQLARYIGVSLAALGVVPTRDCIVAERFFDEAGDTHLIIHSPFGSRLNRAWGLALRKRFCRRFNFELQAAADEDAIVLSLGPTHSFPLEEVFDFLSPETVRHVLVQALLDAPMFTTRWRWNLNRCLAVPRFWAGRKVPPQIQRMQSEDMLAVVFPDQLACLENIAGDREIPDHPMVEQTVSDCLTEAMDIEGLEALLERLESGDVRVVARDLSEPSPLAHQVLNASPYAYLDDAPLEERRTRAVRSRGVLDADEAGNLARLDVDAIERVRDEVYPDAETADQLHDHLMCHGFLLPRAGDERELFEDLCRQGRATAAAVPGAEPLWVATERTPWLEAAFDDVEFAPDVSVPERYREEALSKHEALVEIVRSRLDFLGPSTADELAAPLGLSGEDLSPVLLALESEGGVFRGEFTPDRGSEEWCERRLLARIHRYTLRRLRNAIKPVAPADFMRFLFEWQGLTPGEKVRGPEGVARVVEQLAGVHVAAGAWEMDVLPARVEHYDPAWLDTLCLSGRVVWGRLDGTGAGRTIRSSPTTLVPRERVEDFVLPSEELELGREARAVLSVLEERGASFFSDLVKHSPLLKSQVETGLGELVASGVVTSDGFTGLRRLLMPADRRSRRKGRSLPVDGLERAGRWSVIERAAKQDGDEERIERVAWTLLRRYGVVFRRLVQREPLAPWRDLLYAYRRLEARGSIRGGRFVSGFVGEQFALTEAVGKLRAVRRRDADDVRISLSAADPLNLTGVITAGERVPAIATNRILYENGVPVAALEAGEKRFLVDMEIPERADAQRELVLRGNRRGVP